MAIIRPEKIELDLEYVEEKGGILNALSFASAQYLYKVLEKHKTRIRAFDDRKLKELRRSIVHADAHQDEYFAELLFRAILPPYLKDLEIREHTLISKDNDTFAKISWTNAAVFGIGSIDNGGATALKVFDEHTPTGERDKPSCSQIVADEFLENRIPWSIRILLDEINKVDSSKGAHNHHLKHYINGLNKTFVTVGYDEIHESPINKYLTENWKRAIIDACLVAIVYAYENRIFLENKVERYIDQDGKIKYRNFMPAWLKAKINESTQKSIEFYSKHTVLSKKPVFYTTGKGKRSVFEIVKDKIFGPFGTHAIFNLAIWDNKDVNDVWEQILTINRVCYALEECWGKQISSFVMAHLWQCKFQEQMMFEEISRELKEIINSPTFEDNKEYKTVFGSFSKTSILQPRFKPEKKTDDNRTRNFSSEPSLCIYDVILSNPEYFNAATVFKNLINDNYGNKGNEGFGLLLLKDKTINSNIVNAGPTIPYNIWCRISDTISYKEPNLWFQLKPNNIYADFILNRNKAHQEVLPSNTINVDFLSETIKTLNF